MVGNGRDRDFLPFPNRNQGVLVMTKKADITIEYLIEALDYDPLTGESIWNFRPIHHFKDERAMKIWNTKHAGKPAGTIKVREKDNYKRLMISIDHKQYGASHLYWFIMTGSWPETTIDHDDTNPLNNKFSNLRLANQSNQEANKKVKKGKKLPKGVSFHKKNQNFRARLKINQKEIHLGTFDCPAAASCAYQIAADIHFGEFARAF